MQRTEQRAFIGRYYHALEQKGRLSIPSSFRQRLNRQAVITAGLDGCLFLLENQNWESLLNTTQSLAFTNRRNRDWIRYLANNASQVDIDAQGRILIPEHLRQLVGLKNNVVIVGSVDRIEIWDQPTYHKYLDNLINNVESIAESINQPI